MNTLENKIQTALYLLILKSAKALLFTHSNGLVKGELTELLKETTNRTLKQKVIYFGRTVP